MTGAEMTDDKILRRDHRVGEQLVKGCKGDGTNSVRADYVVQLVHPRALLVHFLTSI